MASTKPKNTKISSIAYLTLVGCVIAIFMSDEERTKHQTFHIRQSIGLQALFYLLGAFLNIFDSFIISTSGYVIFILLFFYGFTSSFNKELKPVPMIGKYFQTYITFIKSKKA